MAVTVGPLLTAVGPAGPSAKGAPPKYFVYKDPGDGNIHGYNNRTGTTDYNLGTTGQVVAALLTTIGGTPTTIAFSDDTHVFAANLTIPSNVGVVAVAGTLLSPSSGITLTINGPLHAEPCALFSGAGTVVLGIGSAQAVLPEWWGAGNAASTTVNTAAFTSAAIAANGAGAALLLQPGVAYAGSLNLPTSAVNARILAFGAKLQPTGTNTGFVAVSPTDCHVYGLEIDGTNQTGTSHGVYTSGGSRVGYHGVHIHHTHDNGVFFDGGTDVSADECRIHNAGNTQGVAAGAGSGIFARGFTRLSVIGNHVHDCPNQFSHGIIAQADAAANAWTEVVIADNVVENCGGNYAGGGGIAVASSSSSPTYRGTKAAITGNTVNNSGDGGIWVNADEVAVTGNMVDGTLFGWPIEIEDCQIVTISGNTVRSGQQDNIMVWQGTNPQQTMRRLIVSDNVVEGSITGNGINISGTIGQVVVQANTVCANHLNGMSVGNNEQAAIVGNTVSGNGSSGIVVTGVTDFTVTGNTCTDNEQVATGVGGLRIYGGAHGTITGNRSGDTRTGAAKTQTYGIQLDNATDYLVVANNELQGNKTGTVLNNVTASQHNQIIGDPTGGSTLTPGASTWSYTAGPRLETLYFSGGSGVTVFISGFTSGLTALPVAVTLAPNQAIAVQYTTVPTINRDIH